MRPYPLLLMLLVLNPLATFAQPVANFTATPTVGCAPMLVQFTSTSTGNPTSYQWNLGNSATSVLPSPSTTYTTPGTYTVTLTVSNANGSNTKTVTNYITVLGNPVVNFTVNDTAGCPPQSVVFTNASDPVTPGPATYSWSFGDGNTSTQQNPSHTFPYPGFYNITLSVTNSGGCVTSVTKPNYVHAYTPPAADFSAAQTSYCITPSTVSFTSIVTGSGPYTYNWDFGDGGNATGNAPTHTYTTSGTYTVQLIVTEINGCKDTLTKPAYITVGALVASFAPASGCVNTPITFNNTSIGAVSHAWDFGDGSTNLINPTHTYTSPGTYNVRLIVYNSSCADTFIQPVTIHPNPVADFTFTQDPPCHAPETIQFNNQTTGGATYTWTLGDGNTSTIMNPVHNYLDDSSYLVTMIATSAFGCMDTVLKPLVIHDLILLPEATPFIGCVPLTVNFNTGELTTVPLVMPYPFAIASYHWNFGDGNSSTLKTPQHTYTSPGTYVVTQTVTTVYGCVQTDTVQVHVGTLPTASFIAMADTICVSQGVTFVNTSVGATYYVWDFGDNVHSQVTSLTHVYNSSGHFTVTLHAFNNGCADTFKMDSLILVHPPKAMWSAEFDCDTPLMVKFYDSLTVGATSHMWYFGDNTTSTAFSPVHTFPSAGQWAVSLVTFNNIYNCSDTLIDTIKIIDPVASFVTADTAICKHDSIAFFGSYTDIPIEFAWFINNTLLMAGPPSSASFSAPVGFRFDTSGLYTITLVVSDVHQCRDTVVKTNYILVAKPEAEFTGFPLVGCTPLNVTFLETSSNTQGAYSDIKEWTFGDGNVATVNTATTNNVYTNPGLYTVSLIVTDNIGCKDTITKIDYIDARKPSANFHASDTNACIGQPIAFINTSSGTSLTAEWDFGDGTTSLAYNPNHAYTQTGTYTIRLIVTDPTGCKDTMTKVSNILISKPTASFTMSDTLAICPPLNVLFSASSAGVASYAWNFGGSGTSLLQNPTAVYTNPGVYNISLVVTSNEGCKDTVYGTASVLGYAGGLSYTPLEGCVPHTVQFTANLNNVPTIIWDFSDGVTTPANGSSTITHTYTTPGIYIPRLILSNGVGCLNSSNGIDTIKVDGVYAGFEMSRPCEETLVQFQDTSFSFFSSVSSWYWSFNNGQTSSTVANPTNFYPTAGTYPVVLIATNANGCTDTVEEDITVFPLPDIRATADTIICGGDAATLEATGGNTYQWNPPGGLSCNTCAITSASPATNTSYIVIGTDIHGCKNKDTTLITLQYITTSMAGPGGEICQDSSFQLYVTGAHRYEWTPAVSLSDGVSSAPVASPRTTTLYTVKAWEGSCLPDSQQVKVLVFPKPTVDAGRDEKIVAGASVMLNATGTLISGFRWSPAGTLSCETCSNPTASPKTTTTYEVQVNSTYGCKNKDLVTVHILCDESQLFVPNYFSPDGDGNNDQFYPRGEGLKMITAFRIYNRWGEVLFERGGIQLNDMSNAWDGRYKGEQVSPDVYVYLIQGICEGGETLTWKGDVTLGR